MTVPTNSDVVVIGAGFAGVAAARDLSRAGFAVAVVEARDRIGGRTWTSDSHLGHRLELGGAFVHWQQPHIWSELVAHGIELEAVPAVEAAYWVGPEGVVKGAPETTYALMLATMTALSGGVREAFPRPHNPYPLTEAALKADQIGIGDFLKGIDLTAEETHFARSFLSLAFSGDPDDGALSQMQRLIALAGGDWTVFLEAMSAFTIRGGTSALIEAMHAESSAATYLDSVVASVHSDHHGATVTTTDGRVFEAKKVIVTAPLNVLTAIEFSPPLSPAKMAASKTGQVSKGVKVWMRARGSFEPFIAFAPYPHPLHMAGYEYDIDGDTILLGFGGDADLLDVTDVRAVEQAMRLWLPDIELLGVHAHDWTHDPFSGETWAMYGPGQLTSFGEEFQIPDGDVHIAGGDYALGWAGHIDGAIESGRRAAHAVAQAITHPTD